MYVDFDELKEGCPQEIQKSMIEIISLSEEFVNELEIAPLQHLDEIKINLQEAKNNLFKIIGRFVTLISAYYSAEDSVQEMGLKFKFEEDIGAVMSELKKKPTGKQVKSTQAAPQRSQVPDSKPHNVLRLQYS